MKNKEKYLDQLLIDLKESINTNVILFDEDLEDANSFIELVKCSKPVPVELVARIEDLVKGLEFMCPQCGSEDSIRSNGDLDYCIEGCGYIN